VEECIEFEREIIESESVERCPSCNVE